MDKNYFIELLIKYREGHASEEERRYLFSYYELFGEDYDGLSDLDIEKINELKEGLNENIWNEIEEHESGEKQQPGKKWISYLSVAAILLVFMSVGIYFYTGYGNKNEKIVRQISDFRENNEHRLIRLPDGSTVIVGAGSKFNYPSSFDGLDKREVYLEGQAYFDVKRNTEKPFIIHTGKVKTTVLGTAFNIKAWPSEKNIIITVSRGKVKVDDQFRTLGIITPDQQITYDKEKINTVQKNVNALEFLSWKEQDLLLDNVTLAEAAELLTDRYKVNVAVEGGQISAKRFTTNLLKNESLEQVLKSICEFNDAIYIYDRDANSVIIRGR